MTGIEFSTTTIVAFWIAVGSFIIAVICAFLAINSYFKVMTTVRFFENIRK